MVTFSSARTEWHLDTLWNRLGDLSVPQNVARAKLDFGNRAIDRAIKKRCWTRNYKEGN